MITVIVSFLEKFVRGATMNQTTDLNTTDCHSLPTPDFATNATIISGTCDQTATLPIPSQADSPITSLSYISFTAICTVSVLGLLGNFLTLAVTLKFQKPLKGHDILIVALAVIDFAAIITTPFNHPDVYEVLGMDIRAISTVGCKLFLGIWTSLVISSSVILVLISIERFVAVWFPLKAKVLLTRVRILRSMFVSVSVTFLVYVTLSVLYCEIQNGLCYPNPDGSAYSTVLQQMPDTTAYNTMIAAMLFATVLTLSTLTSLTIGKLIKQIAIRRSLSTPNSTSIEEQSRIITAKLSAVVVAHLVLVSLPSIATGITGQMGINIHDVRVLHSAVIYGFIINHSTNFLIYHVFDSEFRKRVASLLGVLFAQEKTPNVSIELQEIRNE